MKNNLYIVEFNTLDQREDKDNAFHVEWLSIALRQNLNSALSSHQIGWIPIAIMESHEDAHKVCAALRKALKKRQEIGAEKFTSLRQASSLQQIADFEDTQEGWQLLEERLKEQNEIKRKEKAEMKEKREREPKEDSLITFSIKEFLAMDFEKENR